MTKLITKSLAVTALSASFTGAALAANGMAEMTSPLTNISTFNMRHTVLTSNHWNEPATARVAIVSPIRGRAVEILIPSTDKKGSSVTINVPCNKLVNQEPLLSYAFSRMALEHYPKHDVVETAHTRLNAVMAAQEAFNIGKQDCLRLFGPNIGAYVPPITVEPQAKGMMKLPFFYRVPFDSDESGPSLEI